MAKIVLAAAAKNLTPVTLELGGKCPAYIDQVRARGGGPVILFFMRKSYLPCTTVRGGGKLVVVVVCVLPSTPPRPVPALSVSVSVSVAIAMAIVRK